MAYQRFNQNDMSFIADTKEDLKTLPKCSMGSTCYIIDEARKYMMNSKGEWIPQEPGTNNNTGGGNSDSGGNNVDLEGYLTEEEAKEIFLTKEDFDKEKEIDLIKKYKVIPKIDGTIIDYREEEIRVFFPENAKWEFQNPGENGDKNQYYFEFRTYAPKGAVAFREDMAEQIGEEIKKENLKGNAFAGVDEEGNAYSIVWLAAAKYDIDAWQYYGDLSTVDHMLGFFYTVEWYDENDKIITMDSIRINLTNKDCHSMIEPYYISQIRASVTFGTIGEL